MTTEKAIAFLLMQLQEQYKLIRRFGINLKLMQR